jgi:hypothetical protein
MTGTELDRGSMTGQTFRAVFVISTSDLHAALTFGSRPEVQSSDLGQGHELMNNTI